MTRPRRHAPLFLASTLALALAACAPTPGPTGSPAGSVPASATPSAAAQSTSDGAPSDTPPAVPPSASPVASEVACPVTTQTGLLPSDRLVDLAISSTPTHDLLTFVFAPSSPSPAGPPRGTLEAAQPPFSFAGSGQTFPLLGEHAVQLRFTGMTLASESGEATYHGPTNAKLDLTALREAVQYDASEGVVGWVVGFDGPGCVTLARNGNDVTVMIAHAEAPAG